MRSDEGAAFAGEDRGPAVGVDDGVLAELEVGVERGIDQRGERLFGGRALLESIARGGARVVEEERLRDERAAAGHLAGHSPQDVERDARGDGDAESSARRIECHDRVRHDTDS